MSGGVLSAVVSRRRDGAPRKSRFSFCLLRIIQHPCGRASSRLLITANNKGNQESEKT